MEKHEKTHHLKHHEENMEPKSHHKEKHSTVKKKSNKFWVIIAVIILIPVLVLGYLGFVPIVSDILGANKPVDLGVKATAQDYASASLKLGRSRETLPAADVPETSLRFSGSHDVDTSFTQEEVTATMQTRKYRYNPLGNDFQARFNNDGTVEMSGTIRMNNLRPYGKASGVSDEEQDEIMDKVGLIKVNPAFYVKGTGYVQNNRLYMDVKEAKLGRLSVPTEVFEGNYISNFVEDRIQNIPGLRVDSLKVEEGELRFKGTYPDKSYYDTGE
jgi:hypothetical protein